MVVDPPQHQQCEKQREDALRGPVSRCAPSPLTRVPPRPQAYNVQREIDPARRRLNDAQSQERAARSERDQASRELDAARAQLTQTQTRLAQHRADVAQRLAKAVAEKRASAERTRTEIRRMKDEAKAAAKAAADHRASLATALETTKTLKSKLAQTEKSRDAAKEKALTAGGAVGERNRKLQRDIDDANAAIEAAKKNAAEIRSAADATLADLRATKERAAAAVKERREVIARYREQSESIDKTTSALKASLAGLQSKVDAQAGTQVDALRKEEADLLDKKSALDQKAAAAAEEIQTAELSYNRTVKKRANAAARHTEATESLDREMKSVRKLLVRWGSLWREGCSLAHSHALVPSLSLFRPPSIRRRAARAPSSRQRSTPSTRKRRRSRRRCQT